VGGESSVVLFDGGVKQLNTAWGGRTGLDAACRAAATTKSISKPSIHALISVAEGDEIRDMPSNYEIPAQVPIVGPTDIVIANGWADLLDGSIATTLLSAEVVPVVGLMWLSGSTESGALDEQNCQGWTYGGTHNTIRARFGSTSSTSSDWISNGVATAPCSSDAFRVLCVAY
jgi:hypothetical protein